MKPDAVILAGGEARRMGGGDKVLTPLAGRPMLAHILDRLAGQVGRIAVSANGDPARFAGFGLDVLSDEEAGQGPLAGVLAAMDWARGSHVLTVPGDAPFLPHDLVARLEGGGLALAASPSGLHPTFGLWPLALAPELRGALLEGQRQVRRFAEQNGARIVAFPDDAPFLNVNTPEDLAEAEARLSRMSPSPGPAA